MAKKIVAIDKKQANSKCAEILKLSPKESKKFNPMEKMDDAFKLAEFFTEDFRLHKNQYGFKAHLRKTGPKINCEGGGYTYKYYCASEIGPTIQEAICRAALSAMGMTASAA